MFAFHFYLTFIIISYIIFKSMHKKNAHSHTTVGSIRRTVCAIKYVNAIYSVVRVVPHIWNRWLHEPWLMDIKIQFEYFFVCPMTNIYAHCSYMRIKVTNCDELHLVRMNVYYSFEWISTITFIPYKNLYILFETNVDQLSKWTYYKFRFQRNSKSRTN